MLNLFKNIFKPKQATSQDYQRWLKDESLVKFERENLISEDKWQIQAFGASLLTANILTVKTFRLPNIEAHKDIKGSLADWWGITSHRTAIKKLRAISNSNTEFFTECQNEYEQIITKAIKPKTEYLKALEILKELGYSDKELSEVKTIAAFNYGRTIYVARFSANAGYISEAEAWFYMSTAASHAQKTYSSWRTYLAAYAIGRAIMYSGIEDMRPTIHFLLYSSDSPFQFCEFSKPVVIPVINNTVISNELSEFDKQIHPFFWTEYEGNYSFCLDVGEYKADVFKTRANEGFVGNGYDWQSLAYVFAEEKMPELTEDIIDFDSEADTFCVHSRDSASLKKFALGFKSVCDNHEIMSDLFSRAEID